MYKLLLRPLIFLFPPEAAHQIITFFLKIPGVPALLGLFYGVRNKRLEREVFGIRFPNPVGLAAGFDKDAKFFDEIASCGFGFIEVGTVTPKPQPGNDKPRSFRLPDDEALINRMGFNNQGVQAMAERLKKRKNFRIIIGGNIGKNKSTPNEQALEDYKVNFKVLYDLVDYFVVNVSSPNTPGLRALQEKEPLKNILRELIDLRTKLSGGSNAKPLLLKIAPDLTNEQLDDIVEIIKEAGIDGVVATNTTISREGLRTSKSRIENIGAGGLSGKPLRSRSTEVIRYLYEKSGAAFPIIASGGIHSADDALEKLNAGSSLVQLYTGFIYEGPGLVGDICKRLLK